MSNSPKPWIDKAEDDLASAKKLAAPPDPHWETAAYHCQQAAEKAVKALLVLHGVPPPKKHDIGLLIEQLGKFSKGFGDFEVSAETLTGYATAYRYPGVAPVPLTKEDVDTAIQDAEAFLVRAKELLLASKEDGSDSEPPIKIKPPKI